MSNTIRAKVKACQTGTIFETYFKKYHENLEVFLGNVPFSFLALGDSAPPSPLPASISPKEFFNRHGLQWKTKMISSSMGNCPALADIMLVFICVKKNNIDDKFFQ